MCLDCPRSSTDATTAVCAAICPDGGV
jgi:hypothetical protein